MLQKRIWDNHYNFEKRLEDQINQHKYQMAAVKFQYETRIEWMKTKLGDYVWGLESALDELKLSRNLEAERSQMIQADQHSRAYNDFMDSDFLKAAQQIEDQINAMCPPSIE